MYTRINYRNIHTRLNYSNIHTTRNFRNIHRRFNYRIIHTKLNYRNIHKRFSHHDIHTNPYVQTKMICLAELNLYKKVDVLKCIQVRLWQTELFYRQHATYHT